MRSAITLGLAGLSVLAAPVTRPEPHRLRPWQRVAHRAEHGPIPLYHVTFNQSGRTLTLVFMGKNADAAIHTRGKDHRKRVGQ